MYILKYTLIYKPLVDTTLFLRKWLGHYLSFALWAGLSSILIFPFSYSTGTLLEHTSGSAKFHKQCYSCAKFQYQYSKIKKRVFVPLANM